MEASETLREKTTRPIFREGDKRRMLLKVDLHEEQCGVSWGGFRLTEGSKAPIGSKTPGTRLRILMQVVPNRIHDCCCLVV
jgi:hypothetical protein